VKTRLLRIARALGAFAFCRWRTRRQLRILCYHGIWVGGEPHYGDCLYMSAQRFAERMALLKRLGYEVLPLGEALTRWERGALPGHAVVITIDDAWYGTFKHMVPILHEHRFPATLYVTTYYVLAQRPVISVLLGYMVSRIPDVAAATQRLAAIPGLDEVTGLDRDRLTERLLVYVESFPNLAERWAAVQRLADVLDVDLGPITQDRRFGLMTEQELAHAREAGMDLQLHTHRHRMYDMNEAELRADLEINRCEIARIAGSEPGSLAHFCYPSGVYGTSVFPALERTGIRSATTTEFGLNPPGTHRLRLKRILDCESLSDIELEARLCGFWGMLQKLKPGA